MTRLLPEGECSAEQSTEDCDKVGAPLQKRWTKKNDQKGNIIENSQPMSNERHQSRCTCRCSKKNQIPQAHLC